MHTGVLYHRSKSGVKAAPLVVNAELSSKPVDTDADDEERCEEDSFSAIISEGESSCDEEEEDSGESSGDSYIKAKEAFIGEARKRKSLDQHCKLLMWMHGRIAICTHL